MKKLIVVFLLALIFTIGLISFADWISGGLLKTATVSAEGVTPVPRGY